MLRVSALASGPFRNRLADPEERGARRAPRSVRRSSVRSFRRGRRWQPGRRQLHFGGAVGVLDVGMVSVWGVQRVASVTRGTPRSCVLLASVSDANPAVTWGTAARALGYETKCGLEWSTASANGCSTRAVRRSLRRWRIKPVPIANRHPRVASECSVMEIDVALRRKRQEGNGRGDAVRLQARGILRGV